MLAPIAMSSLETFFFTSTRFGTHKTHTQIYTNIAFVEHTSVRIQSFTLSVFHI